MLGFGLFFLFPLKVFAWNILFFFSPPYFPHTNRNKPFYHSQPHFPLPAFCSELLSGEANKQLSPLPVPTPLLGWPTGLPCGHWDEQPSYQWLTKGGEKQGDKAGKRCGRDTFPLPLPRLENAANLRLTLSPKFTLCVPPTLLVPAASLRGGAGGKAAAFPCFQPSSLCFAMVSKLVLLSWLLMMRLVPCRPEPPPLRGIGPECGMRGGGGERGVRDPSGK